ncbi:putative Fe-containing alcohol dehydrogenase [Durotheca rogersii]|uniref:putative Fe-containing alcohol dehydrogenase n=1 Tax=Durotheca rogersii TaxID=419775 RepID=UPI00221FB079|nr:putative Fe-containing alcohol dehydrogenase [Durotheca rogersii]KAI5864555.1 putative Fe-containing alcohol dehydrogenase [Durotheca rogersii]
MSETFVPAFPDRDRPLVSYGLPFVQSLPRHVDHLFHASRIYVISSRSLAANTTYLDGLKEALGGKLAGVRIGMKPHSHWSEILEVVAEAKRHDADLLVTLGAGSLTDAAKIISFALANDVSTHEGLSGLLPESPQKRDNIKPATVPIVCIPTSLSGGEYSSFAGGTDDRTGQKHIFAGEALKPPALVILDPELTTTTPDKVWLSTGIKAVDHCVETLCSLGSDDLADAAARDGLTKLIPGLLKTKQNPKDLEARLETQLGAKDAMAACSRGVPLGASRAVDGIGHQLGPAGVSHGETSCILNPAVCKYNYKKGANVERQDAIAQLLWDEPQARAIFSQRGLNKETADLGDLVDAIVRALDLPRTLKEFGIGEDKLDGIAERSLRNRWVQSNPAGLDKDGVLEILKMVLG